MSTFPPPPPPPSHGDAMGPPTREIVGIGAPPPVHRPDPDDGPHERRTAVATVYLVIGVLLLALVGGVTFFVTTNDGKSSPDGGGASTAATTPSTLATAPAEAAVDDCVQISTAGEFLATGPCDEGGTPYRVAEVVPAEGTCADPNASRLTSGSFLLCLQVNLIETYCYVLPAEDSNDWITPSSECEVPGTVHVIDVVPDATDATGCTTDYQWNRWYNFPSPQQVACVMQY